MSYLVTRQGAGGTVVGGDRMVLKGRAGAFPASKETTKTCPEAKIFPERFFPLLSLSPL